MIHEGTLQCFIWFSGIITQSPFWRHFQRTGGRGQTNVIVIVMIGNDAFANLCQIVNVTGVLDGEFSADSGYVFNFAIGLVLFE